MQILTGLGQTLLTLGDITQATQVNFLCYIQCMWMELLSELRMLMFHMFPGKNKKNNQVINFKISHITIPELYNNYYVILPIKLLVISLTKIM